MSIYSSVKGTVGEIRISGLLKQLDKERYVLINDVLILTPKKSVQIDHVLVSIYGIFVIEAKNYKGIIIGDEQREEWCQSIYGKKYFFKNPHRQNFGHIVTLQELLKLPNDRFISMVVFIGTQATNITATQPTIRIEQLLSTIRKYQKEVFTIDQVHEIVNTITAGKQKSNLVNKVKHVELVKSEKILKEFKVREGICPECSGKLIERQGPYGKFRGCSNYPKCKFTMK
ncbi:MAG: NERD domain-containing protein [Lachnospiraceae bacterium]|nr:NERD domain-containing protein [Lachnospiraceae bacterium]